MELGGRYPADQNPDGSWNVRGVPIVGELSFGDREDVPAGIDLDWLKSALSRANLRAGQGYLARLHIAHHGDQEMIEPAGFVRPTHLAEMEHGDERITVLFADFLNVPDHVMERIRRGDLPGRSIEFVPSEDPEVRSVALLSTETPQFRFPLLTIGHETIPTKVVSGPIVKRDPSADAVFDPVFGQIPVQTGPSTVAAFSAAGHTTVFSKFGDFTVTDTTKTDELAELKAQLATLTEAVAKLAAPETPEETEGEEPTEDIPEPNIEAEVNPDAEPGDPTSPGPATFDAEAEIAALKAKDRARDAADAERQRKEAQAALVSETVAALSADGWHVDEQSKADFATFAAAGSDKLATFVDHFKRTVPKDGPRDMNDIPAAPRTSEHADEIAKFAGDDRDKVAFAESRVTAFEDLRKRGLKSSFSSFLTTNYNHKGA